MKTFILTILFGVSAHAGLSPLPTGNGFGMALYSPEDGAITRFYAHPYRFTRPNRDLHAEGVPTANYLEKLAWRKDAAAFTATPAAYVNQSQIIGVADGGDQFYFLPFDLQRNALIAIASGRDGERCLAVEWTAKIRARRTLSVRDRSAELVEFRGVPEPLLILPLGAATRVAGLSAGCLSGSSQWALVSIERTEDAVAAAQDVLRWHGGLVGHSVIERELARLEAWRRPAPAALSSEERVVWRQSETVLRIGQIREPNREAGQGTGREAAKIPARFNHGLILASLPPGSWFIPWVRDMAYAVVALSRMGHHEEARWAVDAYLNARPAGRMRHATRGLDYQVSVGRYFGDGSEEADRSGTDQPNLEFDNWGLVLWVAGEYVKNSGDAAWLNSETDRKTTAYAVMRDLIVHPLLGNLDEIGDGLIVTKDTSVWEQNQDEKKHYAFSTIAAINGLRHFATMANRVGDGDMANFVEGKIAKLERGYLLAFFRDGMSRGTMEDGERNEIDACQMEAVNFGVMKDPILIRNFFAQMEVLRTPSGGYRRVTGRSEYEQQEFLLIDFAYARALHARGRTQEADRLTDPITKKSLKDNGLIPEMYVSEPTEEYGDDIGAPTGSHPMVGYGAGAYIIWAAERYAR